MTTARCQQVHLDVTPWYHCTTRCVRQAFICGYDTFSNRDYNHRRDWIEDRLLLIAQVFCIDIGAYAVMSNHYHVVIKIDCKRAYSLTDEEVVQRWLIIYSGNETARRFANGETLSEAESEILTSYIQHWRSELANMSRFMAEINQYIARKANREDNCKGKFWESRFNSQAILDPDALLRTLVYVDLNPVRADITKKPEESHHTSIHRRLTHESPGLIPFQHKQTAEFMQEYTCLPVTFEDYLSLLDWTGRQIQVGKRGRISDDIPPIFQRLNYSPQRWINTLRPIVTWKQKALGSLGRIKEYCEVFGQKWIWQAAEHVIKN